MKTPIVGPYSVNSRLAAHDNAITELAHEANALRLQLEQCQKSLNAVQIIERSPIPGPPGERGASTQGPRGLPGRDGAPGKDGVCVCQTTLNSVQPLRGELANMRAEFAALKATVKSLIDMNTHASEYIAWLQERAAARTKKV